MNNGKGKKVTSKDLQLVQNLIEWCLQLYMNRKEVVTTLHKQASVEPSFTELVWQKLEEENPKFFKAYYLRLILKGQIVTFNKLLEKQAEVMRQITPTTGVASVPIPNGSHVPPYNSQAMNIENMHQTVVAKLLGGITNGGTPLHPSMQSVVGIPGLSRRDDMSPNLQMNQNSNVGIMHGMNGEGVTNSESGYAKEPSFTYNHGNNVLARHPVMPEVHASFFIGEESNPKPVNDPIGESDSSLFGFLNKIPRNFSFSDLTADVSISSDILDNYSGSPFLAADTDLFNPHSNEDIQGRHPDGVSNFW